jgi:glycosyltransferase involved in cell wall biosynthesis
MKIAWFTPFGPQSAIGHYSEAVVDKLAEEHTVTLYAPCGAEGLEPRTTRHPLVRLPEKPDAGLLVGLEKFDVLIYNMGDYFPYHHAIFEVLLRRPGIVVLHDLVMRTFFFSYCLEHHGDRQELVRLAECDHGPEAAQHAREVVIERRRTESPDDAERLRWPLFQSALGRCLGVVTHSKYVHRRVTEAVPVPVAKLDFPCFGPLLTRLDDFRLPKPKREGPVNILTFGMINPNKMVHATIEAIGQSERLRQAVTFAVLGQVAPSYLERLNELIQSYNLGKVVQVRGRVSDDELRDALRQADIAINLRNPHMGESSASLLDALLAGLTTVVWDHGSYAEFPVEVVCKISSEQELGPALEKLAADAGLRLRMGEAARVHALSRFNTATYCDRLAQFIEKVLWNKPCLALVDQLSDRLAEMGVAPNDELIGRLAEEIARLSGTEHVVV